MKKILVVVAALLVAGCAHWVKTEGSFVSDSENFAVDLPIGWMRSNNDKLLLMTKDGIYLQRIVISRINLSDEKQFSATKKRVTKEMLPQEVADVVADNALSETGYTFEKVEESAPATVAGKPGFRLQFTYATKDGLRYRSICYGIVSGDHLYRIMYFAPAR